MTPHKKEKNFDCVGFQRKVREELSKEFMADPKAFMKSLNDEFGHYVQKK